MIEPVDILGRPIKIGDIIAWGHSVGRSSSGLTIGRIEKINFSWKPDMLRRAVRCDQLRATQYTISIDVIETTGYRIKSSSVPILNVKNIVKLEEIV